MTDEADFFAAAEEQLAHQQHEAELITEVKAFLTERGIDFTDPSPLSRDEARAQAQLEVETGYVSNAIDWVDEEAARRVVANRDARNWARIRQAAAEQIAAYAGAACQIGRDLDQEDRIELIAFLASLDLWVAPWTDAVARFVPGEELSAAELSVIDQRTAAITERRNGGHPARLRRLGIARNTVLNALQGHGYAVQGLDEEVIFELADIRTAATAQPPEERRRRYVQATRLASDPRHPAWTAAFDTLESAPLAA
jgi:hypothetical protein